MVIALARLVYEALQWPWRLRRKGSRLRRWIHARWGCWIWKGSWYGAKQGGHDRQGDSTDNRLFIGDVLVVIGSWVSVSDGGTQTSQQYLSWDVGLPPQQPAEREGLMTQEKAGCGDI
jgi:hypothetical protein